MKTKSNLPLAVLTCCIVLCSQSDKDDKQVKKGSLCLTLGVYRIGTYQYCSRADPLLKSM